MLPLHICVSFGRLKWTDSKNTAIKVMTVNGCAIDSFMELDQKDGHILVTMQTKQSAL
jgi:hypothetical protein